MVTLEIKTLLFPCFVSKLVRQLVCFSLSHSAILTLRVSVILWLKPSFLQGDAGGVRVFSYTALHGLVWVVPT